MAVRNILISMSSVSFFHTVDAARLWSVRGDRDVSSSVLPVVVIRTLW
jgi:hypothetical protein